MKIFRYCFLALLFCFCANLSSAQTIKKLKTDGTAYFHSGKYDRALDYLLKYHKQKPGDPEIVKMLGVSFFQTNNIPQAKKYFDYLINNQKKVADDSYLYLAKIHHSQNEYESAILQYKNYLRKAKLDENQRRAIKDDIKRCASGMRMHYKSQNAIVENLGEKVNTDMDEFGPVQSPNYSDRLYFSSIRIGNIGGIRNKKGIVDKKMGDYSCDMYSTRLINGEWSATSPLPSLLNSPRHDVILDFNSTGKVLYFSKGFNLFSGEIFVDTFKVDQEQTLFPSKLISPIMAENGDGTPFFVNDTIVFFSSHRKGGYGGSDLYVAAFANGAWTSPENLGPVINSPYDETTPYLAMDGRTLYFSSNNPNSIGGQDIFKSSFNDAKMKWSSPENLGLPINSSADDAYFRLANDGLKAYFSSSRKTSLGARDIYICYFNSKLREQQRNGLPTVFNVLNPPGMEVEFDEFGEATGGVAAANTSDPVNDYSLDDIQEVVLKSVFYQNNQDFKSQESVKMLSKVASLLNTYPSLKVMLTGNTDRTENPKFDLFASIKSAESAADYLVDNGVNPNKIFLKGAGSNYPIAHEMLAGEIRPAGKKLNRRIDINFIDTEGLPLQIFQEEVKVADFLKNSDGSFYKKSIEGLSYKVEIASIKQMYHSDLILAYPNALVESNKNSDYYHYTVGLYKTFLSAKQLLQDIERQGVTGASLVPYIDGKRVSTAEVKNAASTTFPDLKNYLSYLKIKK